MFSSPQLKVYRVVYVNLLVRLYTVNMDGYMYLCI